MVKWVAQEDEVEIYHQDRESHQQRLSKEAILERRDHVGTARPLLSRWEQGAPFESTSLLLENPCKTARWRRPRIVTEFLILHAAALRKVSSTLPPFHQQVFLFVHIMTSFAMPSMISPREFATPLSTR